MDSYVSHMRLLFPTGPLLRNTQLFQASTQLLPDILSNSQDDNKDGDIPSRSSANLILIQVPRTDDEPAVIQLGAGAQASKQGLSGDEKPATLVAALRAKLSCSRLKNYPEEEDKGFDTLAVA